MNDRMSALKVFVRVARTGSFSRAAKDLGLSQPSASRLITALERQVGASLLIRNTRAVALTDIGADYLARIEPALAMLDEANQTVQGTEHLTGVLRVGLPASIAIRELMPYLPALLAKHPALRVDFSLEDTHVDLVQDSIDVALRFGEIVPPRGKVQWIARDGRGLVASPAYLANAGIPQTPVDLEKHRTIVGPLARMKDAWTFRRRREIVTARVNGHFFVNVNYAATAAAKAGLGVLSTGYWACAAELRQGVLVRLLPDWKMTPADVYAVFAQGPSVKPAAKAFADFMKAHLAIEDLSPTSQGKKKRNAVATVGRDAKA